MYTSRIIAACMNYINNEMSHRDYMWMDRYLTWSDILQREAWKHKLTDCILNRKLEIADRLKCIYGTIDVIYWEITHNTSSLCYYIWRRVICSKFIFSKNLLDTKILTARHRSSRWQKYIKLLENQKSMPYVSRQADASFRSKWTTARIASAQQKIKKMSTAWQYF